MQADRFEDIIAIVALYRPGPMENYSPSSPARWARSRSTTCIPMLEPILKETFGVIVYQEQVMQIAQVLSGYSLGKPIFCAAPWARRSSPKWTTSANVS